MEQGEAQRLLAVESEMSKVVIGQNGSRGGDVQKPCDARGRT